MKRQRVSLGELCTLVKGVSPISKTSPGAYPLVTTGEDHKAADNFQFDGEAVCIPLISSTGHGHASLNRVHYQTGKFALSNLLAAAQVKNQSVLSGKFLARYLAYTKDRLIVPLMTGAANMSISIDRLATVPVEFPSLAEQERIVKLLDEADELRHLRSQADRRTAALVPALFHEMFGDLVENPNAWPTRRLEDVVTPGKIVTYGIVQAGPNIPDGVPYIRAGDLKEGIIKLDGLLRTSTEIAASYRRSEVTDGDIVMSIRATAGTTAIVPKQLTGANLTQGTARISPGPVTVTDYLLWFLRMPTTQSWIQAHVKGATFREITLGTLRQLPVLARIMHEGWRV